MCVGGNSFLTGLVGKAAAKTGGLIPGSGFWVMNKLSKGNGGNSQRRIDTTKAMAAKLGQPAAPGINTGGFGG